MLNSIGLYVFNVVYAARLAICRIPSASDAVLCFVFSLVFVRCGTFNQIEKKNSSDVKCTSTNIMKVITYQFHIHSHGQNNKLSRLIHLTICWFQNILWFLENFQDIDHIYLTVSFHNNFKLTVVF